MNKFTLTIELGNQAMQTPRDVAQALRDLALKLDQDRRWYPCDTWKIRDENGNTVGNADW